jgi:hypothetical protein
MAPLCCLRQVVTSWSHDASRAAAADTSSARAATLILAASASAPGSSHRTSQYHFAAASPNVRRARRNRSSTFRALIGMFATSLSISPVARSTVCVWYERRSKSAIFASNSSPNLVASAPRVSVMCLRAESMALGSIPHPTRSVARALSRATLLRWYLPGRVYVGSDPRRSQRASGIFLFWVQFTESTSTADVKLSSSVWICATT